MAARYRDTEKIWRGHKRGRHARAFRHIPLFAYRAGYAFYLPRHRKILSGRGGIELYKPDGDAVPIFTAAYKAEYNRALPQCTGDGDDAGRLDKGGL